MLRHAGSTLPWLALCVLLITMGMTPPAWAGERMAVRIGPEAGMDVDAAHEVAVGSDGALWFATRLGLRRYDGWRVQSPVPDAPPHPFALVAPRPQGGVYACDSSRALYVVELGERRAVTELPGTGPVWDVDTDQLGRLWIMQDRTPWMRQADGSWTQPLEGLFEADEFGVVLDRQQADLIVTTNRGAFRVGTDGPRRLVGRHRDHVVMDAVELDDGRVLTLSFTGAVTLWHAGVPTVLARQGRGIDLQQRGDRTWVSWDHGMGVFHDGVLEVWSVPTGGPFALGPDGVLIQGNEDGLWVWPEPDTQRHAFTLNTGGTSIRSIAAAPDGRVGIGTWSGGVLWQDGQSRGLPKVPTALREVVMRSAVCPALDGSVWFADQPEEDFAAVGRWTEDAGFELMMLPTQVSHCTVDDTGVVWFATREHLVRVDERGMHEVADVPHRAHRVYARGGWLWLTGGGTVCKTRRDRLSERSAWTCLDAGALGATEISGIEQAGEAVLISTSGGGLLRHQAGQLRRHPRSDAVLGSRDLHALAPSPRGGIWVAGRGVILRVRPDDLEVLERVGAAQGVDRSDASAILETRGGDLLIGTSLGLVEVPARARRLPPRSPTTRLVALAVNGHARDARGTVRVPAGSNRVALQVAAMSLREPGQVRFRVRVDHSEEFVTKDGSVQLFDLTSGLHRVDVAAGLPGRPWSEPVSVVLEVATPWWRTTPFLLMVLAAQIGLALAAYRGRVAWLLARERQRTDIAMDLHDELGSGLGSIRLLASVIDRPSLSQARRQELARRIERVAGELHESVQELVGSLRPGGSTIAALIDRVGERARNLFPDEDAALSVMLPQELAQTALSLPVRRELERIAAEALHNAARHGEAARVTIGVRGVGRRLELWIDDDGRGFSKGELPAHGGLGLRSMQERGQRIGAAVSVRSAPGQGTTVSVRFDPLALDERRSRR